MKNGASKSGLDALDAARLCGQLFHTRMGLQRDSLEPFISQKTEIDGRGGDQETLVGADVRSRLTPPNMLLPGLQGQGVSWLSSLIQRSTNYSTRHLPNVSFAAAHKTQIRSS